MRLNIASRSRFFDSADGPPQLGVVVRLTKQLFLLLDEMVRYGDGEVRGDEGDMRGEILGDVGCGTASAR